MNAKEKLSSSPKHDFEPFTCPKLVILLSGKRKSGKDFITAKIQQYFGNDQTAVVRLSSPLKRMYAEEHGLDFEKLLDSSSYKEQFRKEMILWGERQRAKDPTFFCYGAIQDVIKEKASAILWIVSDARRVSDLQYFKNRYPHKLVTCRILASDAARKMRGWKFCVGVDDAESECGLDQIKDWDITITNDCNFGNSEETFQILFQKLNSILKSDSMLR